MVAAAPISNACSQTGEPPSTGSPRNLPGLQPNRKDMNDHQGSRRARLSGALFVSTVLLTACSGGLPGSSAGPAATTPAAAATPVGGHSAVPPAPGEELFAVLEPGGNPATTDHDTVAIVGLDGVARAKARFTPRRTPQVFDAATVMQPEARVVNGGVLFAGGTGQVHRLAMDGAVTDVTSFPVGAQQALSFAADPTGTRLVAVRLTYPPFLGPPPDSGPWPSPGSFTQELLSATAGHPATALAQTKLGPDGRPALAAVGWSAAGPLVTTDTAVAVQNGPGGKRIYGRLAHLDASGRPGPAIGGSDCFAWAFLPDDTVLCDDGRWLQASVRSAAGQV